MSAAYRRPGKPDWVASTPRELYRKGVNDCGVYFAMGRVLEPPANPMRQDFGFWAGIVARAYGVNLEPAGRAP